MGFEGGRKSAEGFELGTTSPAKPLREDVFGTGNRHGVKQGLQGFFQKVGSIDPGIGLLNCASLCFSEGVRFQGFFSSAHRVDLSSFFLARGAFRTCSPPHVVDGL